MKKDELINWLIAIPTLVGFLMLSALAVSAMIYYGLIALKGLGG